jgi:hypothetical protein
MSDTPEKIGLVGKLGNIVTVVAPRQSEIPGLLGAKSEILPDSYDNSETLARDEDADDPRIS